MRPIVLHVLASSLDTPLAAAVQKSVDAAMDRLDVPERAEVALVLSDDNHLRQLNATYRGTDSPTDVLSFRAEPGDLAPGDPPYLGDIVVSVEQATANARAAGHDLLEELQLLAVHGLLHLLGYEDDSAAGAAEMRRREMELGVRPA